MDSAPRPAAACRLQNGIRLPRRYARGIGDARPTRSACRLPRSREGRFASLLDRPAADLSPDQRQPDRAGCGKCRGVRTADSSSVDGPVSAGSSPSGDRRPEGGIPDRARRWGSAVTAVHHPMMTGRFTGTFVARAIMMGLVALITTQLGQTAWAGRGRPLDLATAAGSLAVPFAVVQTRGLSRSCGCRPAARCPGCWLCRRRHKPGRSFLRWPTGGARRHRPGPVSRRGRPATAGSGPR